MLGGGGLPAAQGGGRHTLGLVICFFFDSRFILRGQGGSECRKVPVTRGSGGGANCKVPWTRRGPVGYSLKNDTSFLASHQMEI